MKNKYNTKYFIIIIRYEIETGDNIIFNSNVISKTTFSSTRPPTYFSGRRFRLEHIA